MAEIDVVIETPQVSATVHTVELFFTMQGSAGDTGPAGKSFLQGNFDPVPELGLDGDSFLNNVSRDVFYKVNGAWELAGNIKGADGKEVELQKSATHIQWRYVGDADWIDLVLLSDLKGEDGKEVEIRNNGVYIQRKYTVDETWINLIALSSLAGDDGREVELTNDGTYIKWRYVGDTEWQNLVILADISGTDGKEVEMQKSLTHIQWRYVGDVSWTNLVALSDITGPAGTEIELQKSATHIQRRYVGDPDWIDLVALSDLKGDVGPGVPNGGTEGQILMKKSATDFDSEWKDGGFETIVNSDAKIKATKNFAIAMSLVLG